MSDDIRAKVLVILADAMGQPLPTGHAARRLVELIHELRAEAAELMADECLDLSVSLMAVNDFEDVDNKVKDYMHDWAAAFREGSTTR
jgi:hypothetical protein